MDIALATKIKLVSTGELHPASVNPRTHSDAQIDRIVASIMEFGWTSPILTDAAGNVVAGHGRLLAALKMGLEHVPIIEIGALSKTQLLAYLVADNKLALDATWDNNVLAKELDDLDKLGFKVELTGFASEEVDALLEQLSSPDDHHAPSPGGSTERETKIEYRIVFDDDPQQSKWFEFVRVLKATYPDEETVGARLARFITEHGYAAKT